MSESPGSESNTEARNTRPGTKFGTAASATSNHYDAIVIGAGFSGLQQLHFLKDRIGLKTLVTCDIPCI